MWLTLHLVIVARIVPRKEYGLGMWERYGMLDLWYRYRMVIAIAA